MVAAKGYTPSLDRTAAVADGFGHTLIAIHSLCDPIGNGYCQVVHFFIDRTYLGTDTFRPSAQILSVADRSTGQISVTYASYNEADPFCCPGLPPVTITYTWDGKRLTSSGIPPGH